MSNLCEYSILLSLYNGEKARYLDECLKSLSEQTLQASEIILVYDGFIRDELQEVVSAWEYKLPIKVVRLNHNMGLAAALNVGLEACSNDIVARMDTDDICLPGRFEKQLNIMMENPSIDVLGSQAFEIDGQGRVIGEISVPVDKSRIKQLAWACPMIHPSVVYKREKILALGGYNVEAPRRQDDYELWIRCLKSGLLLENTSEVLLGYRIDENAVFKNDIKVGINRIKVGIHAVISFDNRFYAYLGLFYPLVRALLPVAIRRIVSARLKNIDPRNRG